MLRLVALLAGGGVLIAAAGTVIKSAIFINEQWGLLIALLSLGVFPVTFFVMPWVAHVGYGEGSILPWQLAAFGLVAVNVVANALSMRFER